jgi:hypothetical protein
MIKPVLRLILLIAAFSICAASAHAQQPPDVVQSDGGGNTAMGTKALLDLLIGTQNTAAGDGALEANTSGAGNCAFGAALRFTTSGSDNTAMGWATLGLNNTGGQNTAFGRAALYNNATGSDNTAIGIASLYNNTGSLNTALGTGALWTNTSGTDNTAGGGAALHTTSTGANNIGVGYGAGQSLTTGSNNIDIGNNGVAGESNTIRIGTPRAKAPTFIGGIDSAKVTGSAVYITASGQLGTLASSERYKTRIARMGSRTDRLETLRPVTFHLKSDPDGSIQYGLIAEQVEKVYPELVIRNAAGKIDGVRYDELAPMLLNEVQKRHRLIAARDAVIAEQAAELRNVQLEIAALKQANQATQASLLQMEKLDGRIALR